MRDLTIFDGQGIPHAVFDQGCYQKGRAQFMLCALYAMAHTLDEQKPTVSDAFRLAEQSAQATRSARATRDTRSSTGQGSEAANNEAPSSSTRWSHGGASATSQAAPTFGSSVSRALLEFVQRLPRRWGVA